MNYKKSLVISAGLHSLYLLSFIGGSKSQPQQAGAGFNQVHIEIIDKDNGGKGKASCPGAFGGVGIATNYEGRVVKVYKGYPAERAGVLPGDVISDTLESIRGKPGTLVVIVARRDGIMVSFSIVRETICATED